MDYKVRRSLLVGSGARADRFAEEQRILREHFPTWQLKPAGNAKDGFATAAGKLTVDFAGRDYKLLVEASAKYPHKLPAIRPDGWTPRGNPHMINDGLCVMKAGQWRDFMSLAFLVAKSALWLNKYEIYLERGIWPGAEQHLHGPGYALKKWWHGL